MKLILKLNVDQRSNSNPLTSEKIYANPCSILNVVSQKNCKICSFSCKEPEKTPRKSYYLKKIAEKYLCEDCRNLSRNVLVFLPKLWQKMTATFQNDEYCSNQKLCLEWKTFRNFKRLPWFERLNLHWNQTYMKKRLKVMISLMQT